MVGPLSSEEIEDVVSSVRRLVSNEQSTRRVTRDLGSDRLLLTPALRVVSEVSPLSPLLLDANPSPEPAPPQDEAVADVAQPALPDDSVLPDEEVSGFVEAVWEDEIWVAPDPTSLGEVALSADEAEVVVPAVDLAAPEPDADTPADSEDTGEVWAPSDWAEDGPVPFIPLRRRAEHLAARLAAGQVSDLDDPEDAVHDDTPTDPAPTEQVVMRDVAPELLEDDPLAVDLDEGIPVASGPSAAEGEIASSQRMPTEFLDADGTSLAVLDEAALQEIVRQMIREELQGALGERITRNVRKLVRAEINRALIARDLD